jgi:TetR/AcrR family transcriptional regulator, cholesterol catabolism regulator
MDNRERIIEGTAELFKTYGIKSVTMDSLATYLGMSKRTIYEIFADKDELLVGVFKWMSEKQQELVRKFLNESENAIVAIFKLMEININHFNGMSPAFQFEMKKFYHDVLTSKTEQIEMPDISNNVQLIEKGIKEKLFRKDINPDLVNRCFYSIAKSMMDQELFSFEKYSRREVMQNTFVNYLRGISTPAGLDLINKLELKY